jgi:hypothetical protein
MTDRLMNLTPHAVRLLDEHGTTLTELPPAGIPARRAEQLRADGTLNGRIPVVRLTYGPLEDMPEPAPGTWYVVSRLIADACPDRDDLLVPVSLVRDASGNPIGCRALARGAAIS